MIYTESPTIAFQYTHFVLLNTELLDNQVIYNTQVNVQCVRPKTAAHHMINRLKKLLSPWKLHRRKSFVLCLSWGVSLSAQCNKFKKLLMLSNLSVFVTRHFSLCYFKQWLICSHGGKKHPGENEKKHSRKQMLHHIHGNSHTMWENIKD